MEGSETLMIKWADEPVRSFGEAADQLLHMLDQGMEGDGWDKRPVIGVVNGSGIGEVLALSVECPTMDDSFWEGFEENLPEVANEALMAELHGDTECQDFLDRGIKSGFQGWLCAFEVFSQQVTDDGTPVGPEVEQRLLLFVDIDGNRHGVVHNRGDAKGESMINVQSTFITRALSVLNAASIMSLVRRQMSD